MQTSHERLEAAMLQLPVHIRERLADGIDIAGILFFIGLGLGAVYLAYRLIKNRGLSGALFGAPIRSLVGELDLSTKSLNMRLKVYTFDKAQRRNAPDVGLELEQWASVSWSIQPIALTVDEARDLAEMLLRASENVAHGHTRSAGMT